MGYEVRSLIPCSYRRSRQAVGATQLPIQWLERKADPLTSIYVKNERCCIATVPLCIRGVHRQRTTFTYAHKDYSILGYGTI